MTYKSRLRKLEARLSMSSENQDSILALLETLNITATRLAGLEFTEEWVNRASTSEIAGAAWLEKLETNQTPALWNSIDGYSRQDGSVGKLFLAIQRVSNAI